MSAIRGVLLLILLFFISDVAYSQARYLNKGENSFMVSGGFCTNSDASGFGGCVGYSASGIFDFGISVAKMAFDDMDMDAICFGPGFSLNIIKQDSINFPISVSIGGSYARANYSSDYLDYNNWELIGDIYSFGLGIYGDIIMTKATTIQPYGSFSYIISKVKLSDSYGNSESEDDNSSCFGFGMSLYFKTSPKTIISIEPGLSISEDYTTFSIDVGAIFPLTKQ